MTVLDGIGKWPLGQTAGAGQVDRGAGEGYSSGYGEGGGGGGAVGKDEDKTGNCNQRRQRVKRNAEWARQLGPLDAEKHDANLLEEKLEQDAGNHQHRNHLGQREEAES